MQVTSLTVNGRRWINPPPPRFAGAARRRDPAVTLAAYDTARPRPGSPCPTPVAAPAQRHPGGRLALPGRGGRGARGSGWAVGRLALPGGPVVSPGRGVRRSPRLGHRPLPRSLGVLQQLRPFRRDARSARRLAGRRHRDLQNPERGADAGRRDRLCHVPQADSMVPSSGRRSRAGQGDRGRRPAGLAFHRRHASPTWPGPPPTSSSGTRPMPRSRAGRRCPSISCTCRATAAVSRRPGPSRGTRWSSTPSSGCPTPSRTLTMVDGPEWRHGVSDVHHVERGRRRPRDRARVVAHDGRRQRNLVRLHGRGLQSVHEHSVPRRPAGSGPPISTASARRTARSAATSARPR